MLIQTSKLDDQQLIALDLLCAECKIADGNLTAIYRHLLGKDRGRPSNMLMISDEEKLIGFLGAFFFYEKSCEIAVMVAPEFRRQGIASRMLYTLLPLIKSEDVDTLIFSSPHGLNDDWFTTIGLSYQGSEFQMHRYDNTFLEPQKSSTNIRLASSTDIPALCTIDKACFTSQKIDMPTRLQGLLNDPNHCLFVIEQAGMLVGKAHLNWQQNGARLSDIAIMPNVQGQGLGSTLLTYCVNHALAANKPDIVLDVETTNKHALNLYTRLGFTINNAHDYWNIGEFGLTAFLNRL